MNKMLAKKITVGVVISAALSVLATGVATAHTVVNEGYVIDNQGQLVKDGFGDCVKTGSWTSAMANAACDASLVKKPAPAPVVVAPPAPVVEAPKPAPVVVAPLPPPAPVFKTEVIEKPITIEGASFDTGSAKLRAAASEKMAEVIEYAQMNKDSDIVVTGYTDSVGSSKKNLALSKSRADSVKKYLVKKGVAASRIKTEGLGAANPVGDNKTAAGRQANRRVEILRVVREEKKVRVN